MAFSKNPGNVWSKDGLCAEGICWPHPILLYCLAGHGTRPLGPPNPHQPTSLSSSMASVFSFMGYFGMHQRSRELTSGSLSTVTKELAHSTDSLFDGGQTLTIMMLPNSWFMLDRVAVVKTTPDTTTTTSMSSDRSAAQTEARQTGASSTGSSGVGSGPASTSLNSSSNQVALIDGAVGGAVGGILIGVIVALLFFARVEPSDTLNNGPGSLTIVHRLGLLNTTATHRAVLSMAGVTTK